MSNAHLEKALTKPKTNEEASSLAGFRKKLEPVVLPSIPLSSRGVDWAFPAKFASPETPDVVEKRLLAEGLTGEQPHISVNVTDQDIEVMHKKADMARMTQFQQWIGDKFFVHGDPAESQWLQTIYPEYFEERERDNEERHELLKKHEQILLYGPKSKDDLYFMYLAENDALLREKLATTTGPTLPYDLSDTSKAFVRGAFNTYDSDDIASTSALAGTLYRGVGGPLQRAKGMVDRAEAYRGPGWVTDKARGVAGMMGMYHANPIAPGAHDSSTGYYWMAPAGVRVEAAKKK